MNGSKIRVGIVGANADQSWAAAAHLPALAHLPEFQLTAVATTRQATAERAAEAFQARHAFDNAHALATHPDVDLVVVTVKAPGHAEAVRAAASAGKHVLCEWPLGVDLTEATELAAAVGGTGVVHAIGLQGYHSPAAAFVRDLLAEGRIGRLQAASLVAAGDPLGGATISPSLAWSLDPAAGNTLLTIMVGHFLSTLEHVTGPVTELSATVANLHPQVTVTGTGERLDSGAPTQVALHGRLADSAVVSLTVQGGSGPGDGGFFLRLAGTDGALTITPSPSPAFLHWTDWRIQLTSGAGQPAELRVPDRYRVAPPGVPPGPPANVAALYREVADAITARRPAHPSFHTALRQHRLLAAIEQAAETGGRLRIDTEGVVLA
ncbi:MAG TPA: Gfo/Idh/MocA family oxidoreductase [Natronosporangium sp.]